MIKYYEHYEESEFGPKYKAPASKWDPDKDYGREYANVYFPITTRGYGFPRFSFKPEDETAFYEEMSRLLTPMGFVMEKPEFSVSGMTARRGYEKIYLHPKYLSCTLKKNEIKPITMVLAQGHMFTLQRVDINETFVEMTDDEFEAEMVRRKPKLKKYVLSDCRSTRVKRTYYADLMAGHAAGDLFIYRVGGPGNSSDLAKLTQYVRNTVIPELIDEGYLAAGETYKHELTIRTINKTEQRKRKLYIREDQYYDMSY